MSESSRKSGLLSLGRAAARRVRDGVRGALEGSAIEPARQSSLEAGDPDLPIVARLVVEIRSDGSRTVARGVLEDTANNQTTAVRAEGTTPLQLARALAGSLLTLPLFAVRLTRGLKAAKPE